MRQWKQKIVKSVGVIALIHMLVFGVQGVLLYRYWNHIDEAVQQKEEVAAVKWATKYEVHNLAAKHQMIPYILFDFIFDAIEHQNLLKKNLEKQEKH